jgi:hypothetical protein
MAWVLVAGLTWLLLAVVVALVVGRAVHLAEHPSSPAWLDDADRFPREAGFGTSGLTVVPGPWRPTGGSPSGSSTR